MLIKPTITNADPKIDEALKKLVLIEPLHKKKGENIGAGFLITKEGHIITANHVIRIGNIHPLNVKVFFIDDKEPILAEVIDVNNYLDIALLKIKGTNRAIVKNSFQNIELVYKLFKNKILRITKDAELIKDAEYVYFDDSIKDENQLKDHLNKIIITRAEKEKVLTIWQKSCINLPRPFKIGDSRNIPDKNSLMALGHPGKDDEQMYFVPYKLNIKTYNEFGRIILNGDLYPGNSGGPVINFDGKVIGIALKRVLDGSESIICPIHFVRFFLQSVGIDIEPPDKVTYYKSEIEWLNKKLGEYERILHWYKADLEWNLELGVDKKLIAGKFRIIGKKLKIKYNKKFDDQYDPADELIIKIYPVFENERFDKKFSDDENLFFDPVVDFYPEEKVDSHKEFEKSESSKQSPFISLDTNLKAKISKYNKLKNTNYRLEDIKELKVFFQAKSKKTGIGLHKEKLSIEYPYKK
jgi:hypothetical protein